MEIAFRTAWLRKVCSDSDFAVSALGESAAQQLHRRIADFRALDTIGDAPVDSLEVTTPSERRFRLDAEHVLVCRLDHVFSEAEPDWNDAYRMSIDRIEGPVT